MAQGYKIKQVKKQDEWQSSYGTFQSYALALEGVGEPVKLNKKVPVTNEPQVGGVLYGEVETKTNKAGMEYLQFKSERKQESHGGQDDKYWEDRNNNIRAQFAIKTAVDLLKNPEADIKEDLIEHWAKVLYSMVDRVSEIETKKEFDSATDLHPDAGTPINDTIAEVKDEPIDLDSIPF